MGKERLSLASIAGMDEGRVRAAVDLAITQCLDDIEDRGQDEKVRVVALELSLTPELDGNGTPEGVALDVKISHKMPPRRTKTYRAELKRTPAGTQAIFNGVSPDQPRQNTLDER